MIKKNKINKIVAVLITATLSLILVFVLLTLYFKNRVDTSDWKTYTNSSYGISFLYPPTWHLYERNNAISVSQSNIMLPVISSGLTIHIYDNTQNIDLSSWWGILNKKTETKKINDTFNHLPAIKDDIVENGGFYGTNLYTFQGKKMYWISEIYQKPAIVNKILSTLRFTE